MTSPTVPVNYILANTYESSGNLDETRKQVELSIRDVFTASPDRLLYICRRLYDHELFTFHVRLFHSEKGEFIEIKYFGKMRHTFHAVELDFVKMTGFTPNERNRTPTFITFDMTDLKPDVDAAMHFTEPDATYKDLRIGIGMCVDVFQNISTDPDCMDDGFILVERMVDLILHAPEPDLRCLAIDALSMVNRFKIIIRSVAIQAAKDKDSHVRLLAGRLLIASVLMNE
jgi:hypothetical protein